MLSEGVVMAGSWRRHDQNLGLEEWEGLDWEESVFEDGKRSKLGTGGMEGAGH